MPKSLKRKAAAYEVWTTSPPPKPLANKDFAMAYPQLKGTPVHGSSATPPVLRHPQASVPVFGTKRRRAVAEAEQAAQRVEERSGGTRQSGLDPLKAGTGASARSHTAKHVSAVQPGGAPTRVIPTSDVFAESSPADDLRLLRFKRRTRSAGWLIGGAREKAGLPWDAPANTTAQDDGWIAPPRPAQCGMRLVEQVGVHGGAGGAHFAGLTHCSSIWACPFCAAVIRARYANDIQRAVTQHLEAGGGILFVTATLRHTREHDLKTTLNAALEGWRRTLSGRPWTRIQEQLGVIGVIRSLEITSNHGENSENGGSGASGGSGENVKRRGGAGWHPHAHSLIFLEKPPTAEQLALFDNFFFPRWAKRVHALGAGLPDRKHGLDLQVVTDGGEVLAAYLAKVQDEGKSSKVGAELARGDFKTGRRGSRTPFELLDADAEDTQARRLWIEFVEATRGRQAITWTAGLRQRFDLEPEKTPEEVIAEAEAGEYRFSIPGERYDAIRRDSERLSLVLRAVEKQRFDLAEQTVYGVWLGQFLCDPDTGEIIYEVMTSNP